MRRTIFLTPQLRLSPSLVVSAFRSTSSTMSTSNISSSGSNEISQVENSSKQHARELAAIQRAALARAAAEFGQKHAAANQTTNSNTTSSSDAYKGTASNSGGNAVVEKKQQSQQVSRELYEHRKQGKPGPSFKVKRKAPWGAQQLRDAWSEDAMARHDKDSVGERIDREYRYHPEAYLRKHLVWVGWSIPVLMVITGCFAYYWASGKAIWKVADFQTMLNIFRQLDTSPRSALYLPRTADSLPEHFALEEGKDGTSAAPIRRRVGAREEYDALVQQYRKAKAESDRIPKYQYHGL